MEGASGLCRHGYAMGRPNDVLAPLTALLKRNVR